MVGQILGGALALGQGLAGTGSRQQQNQQSFMRFRPEDMAAIEAARGGVVGGTQNLLQQLAQSQQAIRQGFQTPETQFRLSTLPGTGFQFSQTPDAMTRGIAALGAQSLGAQTAAQQQQIAQQFRGQPGASRVLQAQAGMQSRLQQNPLLFQALQQQQGRELAQAQQQMAQVAAQNQAELMQAQQRQAQTEALNRAILGREQAVTGLGTTGLGAQSNLLAQQLGLGQAFGQQITQALARGRSGGLFSDK